ncbi:MAG: membrane protein insertase YidC, partial [Thermodesulfovibrionales bacterium]
MDKRTLVAIILSLVVLIGFQFLLPKPPPRPLQKTETAPEVMEKESAPAVVSLPSGEGSTETKDVRVETDYYIATFTSRGGTIKAFELKSYRDKMGSDVSLLKNPGVLPPLALGTNTDNFALSQVNFSLEGASLVLKDNQTGSIVFSYSSPQFSIKRTYTFYAGHYKFDLRDEVTGLPELWITLGSDFGIFDRKGSAGQHVGPVILQDTDRIEVPKTPGLIARISSLFSTTKNTDEPQNYKGGIHWIAQEDKYFFAAIVPSGQEHEAEAWKQKDSFVVSTKIQPGVNDFMIYAGPK